MKKIIYDNDAYLICEDSQAWEYANDPDFKEVREPTVEEFEDWLNLPSNEEVLDRISKIQFEKLYKVGSK